MAWVAYTVGALAAAGSAAVVSDAAYWAGSVLLAGAWHDPLPRLLSAPCFPAIVPSNTLAGIPDRDADRRAGKRTIAVRFGIDRAVTVVEGATLLAALTALLWRHLALLPDVDGPLVYPAALHAPGLVWLLRARRADTAGPERIDGRLLASLG